jgi:hypothetical protein
MLTQEMVVLVLSAGCGNHVSIITSAAHGFPEEIRLKSRRISDSRTEKVARTLAKSPECGDTQHGAKTESLTKIQQGSIWALRFYCNLPLPAGLSVTTFCSFQREFSPLGVCGSENGNVRLIRFRLSGGCCRSLPGIWTRFLHRRVDFLGIVDH